MNPISWKMYLCVSVLSITGCAAGINVNKVEQVDPSRIAVVIGYRLTAKESIHPGIRSTAWLTVGMVIPSVVPSVIAATATDMTLMQLGEEKTMTVAEAVNDLVFQRTECILSTKGYEPSLKLVSPVDFSIYASKFPKNNYYEHVSSHYDFDQDSLSAFDADAILYIEYEIMAHQQDTAMEQPLILEDLKIDWGHVHLYAASKPPNDLLIFARHIHYEKQFSRAALHETIDGMVRLDDWPNKVEIDKSGLEACDLNTAKDS